MEDNARIEDSASEVEHEPHAVQVADRDVDADGLRSLAERIAGEVLQSGDPNPPATPFADFDDGSPPRSRDAEWKCRCGEMNPGTFDVCWSCHADRNSEPVPVGAQPPDVPTYDRQRHVAELVNTPFGDGTDARPKAQKPVPCPRRGSVATIPNVTVLDHDQGAGQLQIVVYTYPNALIFKDAVHGVLKADICGDCGHVELRVANAGELYQTYLESLA